MSQGRKGEKRLEYFWKLLWMSCMVFSGGSPAHVARRVQVVSIGRTSLQDDVISLQKS